MDFFWNFMTWCKIQVYKTKWKNTHRDSNMTPVNAFDPNCVSVGKNSYGPLRVLNSIKGPRLAIGSFCSIANQVTFYLGDDHWTNRISTFPFRVFVLHKEKVETTSNGNIIVDDDVWIGEGASIMSGVHIGQGAVVAAHAVVTKDVEPYAIVGGVPATVLKYRFEKEMIAELLKIDYGKLTAELIGMHENELYRELTSPSQLGWMPKKGNEGC